MPGLLIRSYLTYKHRDSGGRRVTAVPVGEGDAGDVHLDSGGVAVSRPETHRELAGAPGPSLFSSYLSGAASVYAR